LTNDVLENAKLSKLSKLMQAQAYCQLGDFVAASATRDHQQALAHHMQAIKLAEPLSVDPRISVRRAAKEILVDANLAVAHDIAWGRWQQKARVVPKWLERAGSFAADLVQKEHATSEIRLRVNLRTLAAWAGVPDAPDPSTTIQSTIEIGKSLVEGTEDEARKARLAWDVGLGLVDAMEIHHARRQEGAAVEAGTLAGELLKEGEAAGAQVAGHDYLVGRLYYRLGNIHAVNREDHKQAIAWYDKAISLLESPVPATLADNGTQGETFISMAVSYWEIGGRDEAIRLTREGVGLVEKAVEEGLLAKTALVIPYGNLSSMHEELGDKAAAHKYSELAARCEQTDNR
jgi:tetratricopeptide (TPR) repeat protein